MGLRTRVADAWQKLTGLSTAAAEPAQGARKTAMLPSILTPLNRRTGQNATPKPTPANLRKFAETPIARRAINVVKDKIACMDWSIRLRRGYSSADVPDAAQRIAVLRRALEEPNAADSATDRKTRSRPAGEKHGEARNLVGVGGDCCRYGRSSKHQRAQCRKALV